jgi:Fe-S cluster biogenesis protein NfuA
MEKQVLEVLHNLNWLLEPHNSSVELIGIKGNQVIIHSIGSCDKCETDCIGTAFKERLPDVNLVRQ